MSTKNIKRLCVYCGSGSGTDPRFAEAARVLGRSMAEAGIGLVYGAGGNGLMGTIAQSVLDHGGHVTGIIPASLVELENATSEIQERHVVANLHERKMLMFNMADGFIALPGGLGTLEELVEQLTWVQLGQHAKPVIIVNTSGYWEPLLILFEQMREKLFIRPGLETRYEVVADAAEVVPLFERHQAANGERVADHLIA
jgi:uncharacterized protein (TIGR00730 family)